MYLGRVFFSRSRIDANYREWQSNVETLWGNGGGGTGGLFAQFSRSGPWRRLPRHSIFHFRIHRAGGPKQETLKSEKLTSGLRSAL